MEEQIRDVDEDSVPTRSGRLFQGQPHESKKKILRNLVKLLV